MIELGAVVIVGCDVPVDDGVRVIGIRLVEMLRRQDVEDREARRERENQDCSPERADHLVIMDEKRDAAKNCCTAREQPPRSDCTSLQMDVARYIL